MGDGYSLLLPTDWPIVPASEVDFVSEVRLDSAYLREMAANSQIGEMGELVVYTPNGEAGVSIFRSVWTPFAINSIAANLREFELRSGSTDISTDVRTVSAGEMIVLRYTYEGRADIYVYLRTEHSSWHFVPWPRGFIDELEVPLIAMAESLEETYRPEPSTTAGVAVTTAATTTTLGTTTTTTLDLPESAGTLEPYVGEGFALRLPSTWTVFSLADWETTAADLPDSDREAVLDFAEPFFAAGGSAFSIDLVNGDRVAISEGPVILLSAEGYEYEVRLQLESEGNVFESEIRRLPSGVKALVILQPGNDQQLKMTATVFDPARSWEIVMESSDGVAFVTLFRAILDSFADTIR